MGQEADHKDVAEAAAFHQGAIKDVGVGHGAQVIVHIVAAGWCGWAGGCGVLCMSGRLVAHAHHETATEAQGLVRVRPHNQQQTSSRSRLKACMTHHMNRRLEPPVLDLVSSAQAHLLVDYLAVLSNHCFGTA